VAAAFTFTAVLIIYWPVFQWLKNKWTELLKLGANGVNELGDNFTNRIAKDTILAADKVNQKRSGKEIPEELIEEVNENTYSCADAQIRQMEIDDEIQKGQDIVRFRNKIFWIVAVISTYLIFLIILLVTIGVLTVIQVNFLKETKNLCKRMERLVSSRPRNQLLANSGNFGLLNIIKQNDSYTTVNLPCGSTINNNLNY
jgi:hypothetical protein